MPTPTNMLWTRSSTVRPLELGWRGPGG